MVALSVDEAALKKNPLLQGKKENWGFLSILLDTTAALFPSTSDYVQQGS